eukprot:Awhi_evm1s6287
MKSEFVIEFLKTIFKWDKPETIICDEESSFIGNETKKFLEENNVELKPVTAGHHQSNGIAERTVRSLEKSLSKACVQSGLEWDDEIDDVNYFRNRIPNVLGYTPLFMLFKHEANYGHLLKRKLPAASGRVGFDFKGADIVVNKNELDELHNDFRDKQQSISDNNKKRYDKKVKNAPRIIA